MSSGLDPDTFRRACGLWATGVSVVTTVDLDGRPFGLTMNAVSSLSLSPPQFLVCVDHGSDSIAAMRASRVFCINVLSADQESVSNAFARKGPDKFTAVEHDFGVTGAPRLVGALLTLDCRVSEIFAGGDHDIFVGQVIEVASLTDPETAAPLIYYRGRYAALA